jgi:hypothetical protein
MIDDVLFESLSESLFYSKKLTGSLTVILKRLDDEAPKLSFSTNYI